jgi:hypothetical protein
MSVIPFFHFMSRALGRFGAVPPHRAGQVHVDPYLGLHACAFKTVTGIAPSALAELGMQGPKPLAEKANPRHVAGDRQIRSV